MNTTIENRRIVDVRAAVLAGLGGGLIFLIVEMLLAAIMTGSPWGPPRMIAAIALGPDVVPPPATFDAVVLLTAMVIHFILSVIFGVILAFAIQRQELGLALLIGFAFGFILYAVNFYGFTAFFPWFVNARTLANIASHLVFGIATAWRYRTMTEDVDIR